ncbi:MAG: lipoyl(octanoyl) transferase LipB [Thiohalospira sp.]
MTEASGNGTGLLLRRLGRREYASTWAAMRAFTEGRTEATPDELWLLEHPPVFTLGRNAAREHLLDPGEIETVAVDRGGQVTYHGPGQAVLYTLVDLRRRGLGVRALVDALEGATVDWLAAQGITAATRRDAPGVYVDGAKIASLGLRVRHGRAYHGLALNVDADLSPFERINPCGHRGLPVTRLADLGVDTTPEAAGAGIAGELAARLGSRIRPTEGADHAGTDT